MTDLLRCERIGREVAIADRSPADVAPELGLSPKSVRQAKSRVLRRLREELGELIA